MNKNIPHKKHKISLCTTCMGRLHHLKETLPANIRNSVAYGAIEFVLLNYNSNDGMDQWVAKEMKEHIENGFLVYLKTSEPKYWHAAHAKNIVTKYATGEIVVNVDSDCFVLEGYVEYINALFNKETNMFLTGRTPMAPADAVGRVCVLKSDFLRVNGYDENLDGYGFEDTDLYSRLREIGIEEKDIDLKFMASIDHGHADRIQNTNLLDHIELILTHDARTEFKALIVKKDGSFEHFVLLPNVSGLRSNGELQIDESQTQIGRWSRIGNQMFFQTKEPSESTFVIVENGPRFRMNDMLYSKVEGADQIPMFYGYAMLTNQRIYTKNKEQGVDSINRNGFGKGALMVNFEMEA